MAEPQIRFCTTSDGVRIAYATMGEGPPCVIAPYWCANLELDWQRAECRAFLEGLGRGRLLVSFDRRGVGASQREVDDLSLEAQVTDVAALVDHLQLERFALCGWADGAAVSVAYAARHPERVSRLVLWAAYAHGVDIVRPRAIRSLMELIRENWGVARRAMADIIFPSGPTNPQRWLSSSLRESMSPETAARYMEFYSSVDVRSYLPEVRAPTLALHRRGDRSVTIDAGRTVAALIPDTRFMALEGDATSPYFGDTSHLETMTQFLDEGRLHEPAAPAGLVTILFTDIEGSTAMTQRLGDAKARDVLREHERITRERLREHGGSEVKTMGDGFMASFASGTKALECAIAMQRAFAEHNESAEEPIRVRIGLNAGEPIAEEDDLFGTAVIRAARIAAIAQGDEILAANVVRELAEGKGFLFGDRGDVVLRGFDDPVRLFEVRWGEDITETP